MQNGMNAADIMVHCEYRTPGQVKRSMGYSLSLYEMYPERENYHEMERYKRPDGSMYVMNRQVSRWGGEVSLGEWKYAFEYNA